MAALLAPTPARAEPATHLEILTIGDVTASAPFTVTVRALDGANALDTDFTGSVTLSANVPTGGSNLVGGARTISAVDGEAVFTVLQFTNAANNYTMTATSAGLTDGVSNAFNVTARRMSFIGTLPSRVSGATFSLAARGLDGSGAVAENFNGSVTLSAAAPGGSNFRDGSPTVVASAGTASFTNLALDNASSGYQITASSAGLLDGVSNAFNVSATHLAVLPVDHPRAGSPFTVTVEARDATDSLAENYSGSVTLALEVPTGGSASATVPSPVPATSGTSAFTDLVLNDAADGYLFNASATGLTGDASDAFNVTAKALAIVTTMTDRPAGDPFSVSVEARDANGAVAENFASAVSLGSAAVGGSNFVGGSPSVDAAAGSATFDGLTINDAADGYVVTADSTGVDSGSSNAFDIAATHLDVLSNVSSVRSGDPFSVTVEARDADDNLAENFVGSIDLSATASGGSDFGATPSQTAVGGSAVFDTLTLTNAADDYQIAASSATVQSGTGEAFDVTASALAVVTTIPNMIENTLFDLTVEARDASNNLAENFTGTVGLSAAAADGSDFVVSPTAAAVTGTSQFNDLSLGDPADGYVITASSPDGPEPTTSNAFNVLPGGIVRTLTLNLSHHLKAAGLLKAPGVPGCARDEVVKIQRRRDGKWVTIKKTTTNRDGAYRTRLRDKTGKYRAVAPSSTSGGKACLAATSPVRRHRH